MRESYHLPPRPPVSWRVIRPPAGVHAERPSTALARGDASISAAAGIAGVMQRHRQRPHHWEWDTAGATAAAATAVARLHLSSAPLSSPSPRAAVTPVGALKPWIPTSTTPAPDRLRPQPSAPPVSVLLLRAPLRRHQLEGRPWTAAALSERPPVLPESLYPGRPVTSPHGKRDRRPRSPALLAGPRLPAERRAASAGSPTRKPWGKDRLPAPLQLPPAVPPAAGRSAKSFFLDRVQREMATGDAARGQPLWAPKHKPG